MLFLETLHDNFAIMHGKFVCLSCLSHPSGAFCAARLRTPTAAFESLGLRYVEPHLVPYHPHRQRRRAEEGRGCCQVMNL